MDRFDYDKCEGHAPLSDDIPLANEAPLVIDQKEEARSNGLKLKAAPSFEGGLKEQLYGSPFSSRTVTGNSSLRPTPKTGGSIARGRVTYTLASPWRRLAAHVVESIVVLAFMIPPFVFIAVGIDLLRENVNVPIDPNVMVLFAFILVLVLGIALSIANIYLLASKGQTIGKSIVNIRIVDAGTNSKTGFWRIIGLRSFIPGLINTIPLVGSIFSIVNVLFVFSKDNQCLHDKIADTYVIKC